MLGAPIRLWVFTSRRFLEGTPSEIMKRLADGAAAVRVALHQVRSEVGSACCFLIREKSFG